MNKLITEVKLERHFSVKIFSFLFLIIFCLVPKANSQEIKRGFVLPVELGQGFRLLNTSPPEYYIASLAIKPSYAFANNVLRIGATGMGLYDNGDFDFFGGPRLAVRVFKANFDIVGELFNVQLTGDALWGTNDKKLFGGGITFEADPLVLSANAWQEYENKEFWFDAAIGLNIDKVFFKKKKKNIFGK